MGEAKWPRQTFNSLCAHCSSPNLVRPDRPAEVRYGCWTVIGRGGRQRLANCQLRSERFQQKHRSAAYHLCDSDARAHGVRSDKHRYLPCCFWGGFHTHFGELALIVVASGSVPTRAASCGLDARLWTGVCSFHSVLSPNMMSTLALLHTAWLHLTFPERGNQPP